MTILKWFGGFVLLALFLGAIFLWTHSFSSDSGDHEKSASTQVAQESPVAATNTPTLTPTATERVVYVTVEVTVVPTETSEPTATVTAMTTATAKATNTEVSLPTVTATAQQRATNTPQPTATDTPAPTATATATQTPNGLEINWKTVGDSDVRVMAVFTDSGEVIELDPDNHGQARYAQTSHPAGEEGFASFYSLDDALYQTMLPFRLEGNSLVLLYPDRRTVWDQDIVPLFNKAEYGEMDDTSVLPNGCPDADCAIGIIRSSRLVAPRSDLSCQWLEDFNTGDSWYYRHTYRAGNGYTIGSTAYGFNVPVGSGWQCQKTEEQFFFVRSYDASLFWAVRPVQTIEPGQNQSQPDQNQADSGQPEWNDESSDYVPIQSTGETGDGGDTECEDCSQPIIPVNEPPPSDDPTPTPIF